MTVIELRRGVMRLYTKTGDKGETGLIGGRRVGKDDVRVHAYGEVDELNAWLGLAAAACEDAGWRERMNRIQDRLFVAGAELADPTGGRSGPRVSEVDVKELEDWIDAACGSVAPLRQFVLPGGAELGARLHVGRAVCRRAERSVVALSREADVSACLLAYLNRLADLLFAWARLANDRAGVPEVVWRAPDGT